MRGILNLWTLLHQLQIDNYRFNQNDNPYIFTADESRQPIPLATVARQIAGAIDSTPAKPPKLLIRGIQTGHHAVGKDALIARILETGTEIENSEGPTTIFAAPYESERTILHTLEAFHKYRPKCDEKPQHIIDIWMLFDMDAYDNVEYLHPRHNVLARDKWKRKNTAEPGLVAVITIN